MTCLRIRVHCNKSSTSFCCRGSGTSCIQTKPPTRSVWVSGLSHRGSRPVAPVASKAGPSARGQACGHRIATIPIGPEGPNDTVIPEKAPDDLTKDLDRLLREQIASGGVIDLGALCQPLVSIEDGVVACITCVHPSHFFDKPC